VASVIKYDDITPKAYVKNITVTPYKSPDAIIDERHKGQEGVSIVLDMFVRQSLSSAGISEFHELYETMQHVDIYVVQDFTPGQANAGNFNNDRAPENLGTILSNPKARVSAIDPDSLGMRESLDRLSGITDKIQYAKINLLEARSNALDFAHTTAYVDATSYEIPFQVTFFIPDDTPDSLTYRVFTHLDAQGLLGDDALGPASHQAIRSLNKSGSSVTYEPVITAGVINTSAFVLVDSSDEQWLGHWHMMPETGAYMKGAQHGDYQGNDGSLTRRATFNIKINDMRTLQPTPVSERFYGGDVYFDANEYEREIRRRELTANAYGARDIRAGASSLKEAMLEQLMSPTNRRTEYGGAQFDSEILLTTTLGRRCNFLFTIDWVQIVKYQSRLAKLYESLPESSFAEVLNESKIRSMKLWRRRVTDAPIGINKLGNNSYKVFDENELPILIADLTEIGQQAESATGNGSMREMNIDWSSSGGFYYRSFSGTDTSVASLNYGNFQYFIEVDVQDGIERIMSRHRADLRGSIRFMKDFIKRATMPAYVPGYLGNDFNSMPPDQLSAHLRNSNAMVGSYNYETKRYTQQFLESISGSSLSDLTTAVRRYLGAHRIMHGRAAAGNQQTLLNIINPQRGALPEAIQDFTTLMEHLHDSLEEVLASKRITNETDSSGAPMSSMFPDKNSFKFFIYFDEMYDASVVNDVGVSYFANATESSGLRVVEMTERVIEEYTQFYADSDVLINNAPSDVSRTGISLTPNEYHFSSPQVMRNSTLVNSNDFGVGYRENPPEIGYISTGGAFGNDEDRRLNTLISSMNVSSPSAASARNLSFRTPYVPSRDLIYGGNNQSSFRNTNISLLQERESYLKKVETTYVNIDRAYNLGVVVETPYTVNEVSWMQDMEEAEEDFISDPKILASSVLGSGENLCLNERIAMRLPATPQQLVASRAAKFLELLTNKVTMNSEGISQLEDTGNALGMITSLEKINDSNPNIFNSLPMQLRSVVRNGVDTPGVLANGDISPHLLGMMVSVEEKLDTSFGKSGTSPGADSYQKLKNLSSNRVSKKSSNATKGKKYRICRLEPYENREVGLSRSTTAEKTNVMDRYFLVGVE
jgi:hypothetical protein